jgi:hypothetical protein
VAPAALVAATAYVTLHKMLEADRLRRKTELLLHTQSDVLKLRLQGIEQLVLFMERLSPIELVLRTARSAATSAELQRLLLDTIRQEAEKYLPCQIYVGFDTWQLITGARNAVVSLVNQSAAALPPDETALCLSRKILDSVKELPALPTAEAIDALRQETQHLFA